MIDLDAIARDLSAAYAKHLERGRRHRRTARTALFVAALVGTFAAVAVASGIGDSLQLDPAKWTILGGGTTDGGAGAYVHARRVVDGSPSTFMLEHDSGRTPYAAFLLHERTKAAADATSPVPVLKEPGSLCSETELTRAEIVALQALSAFSPGTDADATRNAVMTAVSGAFGGSSCRGLEYGGEQARFVYAGVEPRTMLMPGAR